MNTNEVERRLEALAAGSADPEVPAGLYARLAELENVSAPAAAMSASTVVPFRHRRGSRIRGITVLGLAAALTLTSGVLYLAGQNNLQTTTSPSPHVTAPLPTASHLAPSTTTIPTSIGAWAQIQTFQGADQQYAAASLSWQAGRIVGFAQTYDSIGLKDTCVLTSRDGVEWTCSPLPRPAGLCDNFAYCIDPGAIAVNNGHWVAVGQYDGHWQTPSPSTTPVLTWTSEDGVSWHEQVGARFQAAYDPSAAIQLLATKTGFILSGYAGATTTVLTTTNGAHWEQSSVPAMTRGWLSGDPTTGYLALGVGASGSQRLCAAYSLDGLSWRVSYPLSGVPSSLAKRLLPWQTASSRYQHHPVLARSGGRWSVGLSTLSTDTTAILGDSGFYEVSSPDGVAWTLSHVTEPILWLAADPTYSRADTSGVWAIDNSPARSWIASPSLEAVDQPNWTPSTYWSADGLRWHRFGAAAPGSPLALVDTPTGLVTITAVYPNSDGTGTPTISVWAAPKQ